MKVLHVAGNFPLPPLGGVENIVVHLAEELHQLGTEIRVVGASRGFEHRSAFGSDYFAVPAATVSSWVKIPTLGALAMLRKSVHWADVVHVHNPPELFNFAAIEETLIAHRPLVLTLFSPGQLVHHPRRDLRWSARLVEWLVRRDSLRASAVQVSNRLDYECVTAWGCVPRLIPFGIAEPLMRSPRVTRPLEQEGSLSAGHPRLLFVGRLHPMKGPDHFLRAVRLLRNEYPQIRAVVVGPDFEGSRGRLEQLADRLGIRDKVDFRGQILDELLKMKLFDSSDALVIPSLADFVEGFCIVASEAWARGLPVAAYPVGALRVRVREGENGSLAQEITPEALADAVRRALGLRTVAAPPDVVGWGEVASRFLQVYRSTATG